MNKRIRKKKVNHLIKNIQSLLLKENEFLVFRFNKADWNPQSIEKFAKDIKDKVSNKVIFVPTDINMIKVTEQV
jgi:hypothetical protein